MPYESGDLRRKCAGIGLDRDIEILVPDHIPQNRIQRWVAAGQVRGEIAGTEQCLGRVAEVAVVLTVRKQEVNSYAWRSSLQGIGKSQKNSDSRGTVVSSQDRFDSVERAWGLVGVWASIPVSEVEYSFGRLRTEPGEVVVEVQLLTLRGASRERLNCHCIGRCP